MTLPDSQGQNIIFWGFDQGTTNPTFRFIWSPTNPKGDRRTKSLTLWMIIAVMIIETDFVPRWKQWGYEWSSRLWLLRLTLYCGENNDVMNDRLMKPKKNNFQTLTKIEHVPYRCSVLTNWAMKCQLGEQVNFKRVHQ